jgi:hypothetical protein
MALIPVSKKELSHALYATTISALKVISPNVIATLSYVAFNNVVRNYEKRCTPTHYSPFFCLPQASTVATNLRETKSEHQQPQNSQLKIASTASFMIHSDQETEMVKFTSYK